MSSALSSTQCKHGPPNVSLGYSRDQPGQRQCKFSPRGLQSQGSTWQSSCSSRQPSSPLESFYCFPSHSLRQVCALPSPILLPSLLFWGLLPNSQDPACSVMTLNGAGGCLEKSSQPRSSKNALPSVSRVWNSPSRCSREFLTQSAQSSL